ncbi:alpha-hydroxy-acid oxidizing protein [Angustibacter sp. McL0619]|uniref:alpha-hydroxy-acid oxidizing protein n=1 Tax=Angustibacter sp. McL0619 TaxID=3415676 RepID=UPI003CEAA0F7
MTTGRTVQAGIYREGVFGRRPVVPTSPSALEHAARRRMSRRGFAYVAGSAGQERTARANLAAFARWQVVPRMLRDVSAPNVGLDLFGKRLPAPLLLAPIGVLEMAHREADLAAGRAAAAVGLPMILSSQASRPMEDVASAMGAGPRWFQLYWSSNDDLAESFVRRAEESGSTALVVTLDTHTLGWRTRDLDLGYLPFAHGLGIAQYTSDPVFMDLVRQRAAAAPAPGKGPRPTPAAVRALVSMARHYPGRERLPARLRSPLPRAAVETFLDVFSRPSLTWDNLTWLRERTRLPIVLKGIQHPADATRALDAGVDGIVVSNHGGRQVDGAIASLDALPPIVERVDGRVPVLFDSGVRSGADAFVALALGATAVCLGRPWVYGLALAGERGARAVLQHIWAELELTMALAGCATLAEINRDTITAAPTEG